MPSTEYRLFIDDRSPHRDPWIPPLRPTEWTTRAEAERLAAHYERLPGNMRVTLQSREVSDPSDVTVLRELEREAAAAPSA